MKWTKDIILVTGGVSSGKTFTANGIRNYLERVGIPVEEKTITDVQSLLSYVQTDDVLDGLNHYHKWYEGHLPHTKHSHKKHKELFPFLATGSYLHDCMFLDFFQRLEKLPETGKYWIVEWAGGINTNVSATSPFRYTISYQRVRELMVRNLLPSGWLQRVLLIFHPYATLFVKIALNKKRSIPTLSEIKAGRSSWVSSHDVIKLSGKDDLNSIKPFFIKNGISQINDIQNDGSDKYMSKIQSILSTVFPMSFHVQQRKEYARDIIVVLGRSNSGKKTILHSLFQTAKEENIPHNFQYISDLDSHLTLLHKDDREGSKKHFHPSSGFNNNTMTDSSFVITDDSLVNEIYLNFFNKINQLPHTKKFWFVEWTGGINKNDRNQPGGSLDYSFTKYRRFFSNTVFPSDWLRRVYGILHPVIPDSLRMTYSEDLSLPYLSAIKQHIVTTEKTETVLNMTGNDDSYVLDRVFQEYAIPNVYHFENDNGFFFKKSIAHLTRNLFYTIA